jgi:hypothetical protein
MHMLGDAHDTAARDASSVRLGVGSTIQFAPFHASASAWFPCQPTAMHVRAEVQEMPYSALGNPRLGVVSLVQADPFQLTAQAVWLSLLPLVS